MLLSRTFLIFSVLVLFLLPSNYAFSPQTQDLYAASFALQTKKEIAIFPFRNNTDIPNLEESIPDLLSGELFRSGYFDIVEMNILYKTIWRLAITDLVKIDDADIISSERSLEQEVDLFSKLKRDEIEVISYHVHADYTIRGSVNQFGDLIRVELELLDVYTKRTLDSISAEVNDVESIPNAIKGFIPTITGLFVQQNIEEIADETVGQYRGGLITFETTVSNLKEIALMVPESIYANTHSLILYKERGLNDKRSHLKAIETCKSIVSTISQYNEGALDIFSRLGVDPFDMLANFYDMNDQLQDAADVYANAIKTIPSNSAIYYKKLGIIFLRQEKLEDAIDALKHSIELNLRDFEAHYQLAVAYEMENQDSKALKEYKKCLKYSGGRKDELSIEVVKKKIKELEPF